MRRVQSDDASHLKKAIACTPRPTPIKRAWSPLWVRTQAAAEWASTTQNLPAFSVQSSICPRFSTIQQSNEDGHCCNFTNVLD